MNKIIIMIVVYYPQKYAPWFTVHIVGLLSYFYFLSINYLYLFFWIININLNILIYKYIFTILLWTKYELNFIFWFSILLKI